ISSLFILFVIFLKMFYYKKASVFFYRLIKFGIPILFSMFILSLFTRIDNVLLDKIFLKLKIKATNDDILNHRGEIWKTTLEDSTLLGNGSSYFGSVIEMDAHNTFIKIMGQSGWLS